MHRFCGYSKLRSLSAQIATLVNVLSEPLAWLVVLVAGSCPSKMRPALPKSGAVVCACQASLTNASAKIGKNRKRRKFYGPFLCSHHDFIQKPTDSDSKGTCHRPMVCLFAPFFSLPFQKRLRFFLLSTKFFDLRLTVFFRGRRFPASP